MNVKRYLLGMILLASWNTLQGQPGTAKTASARPWMNAALDADARAALLQHEMTLDEKIVLMHGEGLDDWPDMSPAILAVRLQSNGGDGFVLGISRLGIPALQMDAGSYGVRFSAANGRYSTALPSDLGLAASWDPDMGCAYGALIGRELRAQGFNTSLSGGVNLAREPRNGRTFEYLGEDAVLSGTMTGMRIRCEGEQHVITGIKHFALNDQEGGRTQIDSRIEESALRESDLLAFEIGIRIGKPHSVMCSYNAVNGIYACENKHLLTDILKREWHFPGFVMSDWGATHSMQQASAAGLDQEQPLDQYFGPSLKAAVLAGKVAEPEVDEHVHRILWAMFASGIMDDPPQRRVIDPEEGFEVSQRIAESSAVLLRNQGPLLPLDRAKIRSISIIGKNADTGMISGGGSAQVDPIGSTAPTWRSEVWFPTSPLKAMRAKAPSATIHFCSGEDINEAVRQAKQAEVAIIFAWQWEAEAQDLATLSLPGNQDDLIRAVSAANPRTIVVLETGGPVSMPWLDSTAAVLEVWYAGSKGASAVANLLFGDAHPGGKLPITFPASVTDLPRPIVDRPPANSPKNSLSFRVNYFEGDNIGYKWFEMNRKPVLFPFGFGLSYSKFELSELKVASDGRTIHVKVENKSNQLDSEVVQVYVRVPGVPAKRLAGWQRVRVGASQSKIVQIELEPLALQLWDTKQNHWMQPAGRYDVLVGNSSVSLPLSANFYKQ